MEVNIREKTDESVPVDWEAYSSGEKEDVRQDADSGSATPFEKAEGQEEHHPSE